MGHSPSSDAPTDVPSATPGTVLGGKYRLERVIGSGGMGSVWAGTHIGLGQPVAVKLIARRHANSQENLIRFDLEAKAAVRLRSRFVVQIYDNGVTPEGLPYIVMELLEGESLAQRIDKHGPLASEEAVRLLGQVARALARAHGLGIVHRDLKPDNIFLTLSPDEEGEIAKVLDFGIAKVNAPTGPATMTGAVLGTPLFMSPEQARGLRTVGPRTDIYSFGMLAFAMMTGRDPFRAASVGELLIAICSEPLPSMRAAAPWLPEALDLWLAKACARDPGQRYGTIEEAMNALAAIWGRTRPSSWPPRARDDRATPGARSASTPPPSSQTQDLRFGGYPAAQPHASTPAGLAVGPRVAKTSMWPMVIAVAAALALLGSVASLWVSRTLGVWGRPTAGGGAVSAAIVRDLAPVVEPSPAPLPAIAAPGESASASAMAFPTPSVVGIRPKIKTAPRTADAPKTVAPADSAKAQETTGGAPDRLGF